jgi:hypothetical protein
MTATCFLEVVESTALSLRLLIDTAEHHLGILEDPMWYVGLHQNLKLVKS